MAEERARARQFRNIVTTDCRVKALPMAAATRFSWGRVPGGPYLACGDQRSARIARDTVGRHRLTLTALDAPVQIVVLGYDAAAALHRADQEIIRRWSNAYAQIRADTPWRGQRPTARQLEILRDRGIPETVSLRWTQGPATQVLSAFFNRGRERPDQPSTRVRERRP